MPTGLLGSRDLAAGVSTIVYTVPDEVKYAVMTVNVLNRSSSTPANISIALTANGASPTNDEWIEFEFTVQPRGVLQRTGVLINTAISVTALSSTADVTISASGVEVFP
jgi:hypothetical protein